MDTPEHIQTAREFLSISEREFADGQRLQASEKLWGAVAHAVLALAQQRGWRYGSHNELIQAARRLSEELGDATLYSRFGETRQLHANYYHGFLEDHQIDDLRSIAHDFIRRVLALVA